MNSKDQVLLEALVELPSDEYSNHPPTGDAVSRNRGRSASPDFGAATPAFHHLTSKDV